PLQAGGGTITLANPTNDFGSTVSAGGTGGISLFDVNTLLAGTINAGGGTVTLNAGSIAAGGPITAGTATLDSNSNVSGLGMNVTGSLTLGGAAGTWQFTGTLPSSANIAVGAAGTNVFLNAVGLSGVAVTAANTAKEVT